MPPPMCASVSHHARVRRPFARGAEVLALACVMHWARPAHAGIGTTPLPQFADGKQSVQILAVPGVVKRNRLQTDFLCSVTDSAPVDVGVEVFGSDGTQLNDVHAGVGAVLNVASGQTVTFGTKGTAAYLESVVLPIADVSQGSARVVASSGQVQCNVLVLDSAVTPPTSLSTLDGGVQLAPGSLLPSTLPTFSDGKPAAASAVIPGVVKRTPLNTDIFCTSMATTPSDVGMEIFGPSGTLNNSISAGNGAVLNVAPGATVTFGTSGTAGFLETAVITTGAVAQGSARIVSTSAQVACTGVVLDASVSPPAAMSNVVGFSGASAPPTATPAGLASTPTATATRTATSTPTPSPTATPTLALSCASGSLISKGKLVVGKDLDPPGDETLNLAGGWQLSTVTPPIDPIANGFSFEVHDLNGSIVFQRVIPGGAPASAGLPGWTVNAKGTKWVFRDRTGVAANGITKIVVTDLSARSPGLFKFAVTGGNGNFQVKPSQIPAQLLVVFGAVNQTLAGQCATLAFNPDGGLPPVCKLLRNGNTLSCK